MSVRKTTNALIELAEEGVISWRKLAKDALSYMSERDVSDMAENEGLSDLFLENYIDEY
jgi:hypothetical protein